MRSYLISLALKKDVTISICVYNHKLKALTIRDSYLKLRMDDCIDLQGDPMIFSTSDTNCRCWKVEIVKENRDKTAFTFHHCLSGSTNMLFVLENAAAKVQRAVEDLLTKVKFKLGLV